MKRGYLLLVLILSTFIGSASLTPGSRATLVIGSETITLYPIVDSYVNSSSPDTNYGGNNRLNIYFNNGTCYSYVMFDLSSIQLEATIISAALKLYASAGSWKGPWGNVGVGVHYCFDNSWIELGITWNNKPEIEPDATDTYTFGMFESTGYKSWNVTSDVVTALSSGFLTEGIKFDWGTWGDIDFHSREGASKPKLEVEYTTLPIYNVHLEAVQEMGVTSNLGYTTFADVPFFLPSDVDVVTGSYEVTYQGGYTFVRWETSGDVSVLNPSARTTTVTVSGSGTLRGVGNVQTIQYLYDDGERETIEYGNKVGRVAAVRFTPLFFGTLKTARFYIDYLSYQSYKNTFKVRIMDSNRQDLVAPFNQTPTTTGWFDVDLSAYNISVSSFTDFYIGMEWNYDWYPDLGADKDKPIDGRSWFWNGTIWQVGSNYDYMIRAVVETTIAKMVTKVTLSLPSSVKIGDIFTMTANLSRCDGLPIVGESVNFYYNTMLIGQNMTDEKGAARVSYRPELTGSASIKAEFVGSGGFLGSSNITSIEITPNLYRHRVVYGEDAFNVITLTNSTVSSFNFSQPLKQISFDVTGPNGTSGFCNVTIPIDLLNGDFTILLDDAPISYTLSQNTTHSSLHFTYSHSSHNIKIIGTTVIPEFPTLISMMLIFSTTATILVILKRRIERLKALNRWKSKDPPSSKPPTLIRCITKNKKYCERSDSTINN